MLSIGNFNYWIRLSSMKCDTKNILLISNLDESKLMPEKTPIKNSILMA